jgi:transcriptional regulator with XRE-family HTH domain
VRSSNLATDLTSEEQRNVRTAIRYLHTNVRRWNSLGKAIGIQPDTIYRILNGRRSVTAAMAFRVARLANVSIDDLLAGKTVPAGTCPHCGHPPER